MNAKLAMALIAFAIPGGAFAADVDCSLARPAIPAGWVTKVKLGVASGVSRELPIGQAAELKLLPGADVVYPVAPARAGAARTSGGVVAFTVRQAGTYRVSIGTAAWIDVARGPAVVASSAHAHGPACTGIRKIVDFPLQRGRHVLEISGSAERVVAVMVTRLP